MLDIRQLYESVGVQGSDLNMALAEYQAKRVPESFALMRMVSVRVLEAYVELGLCRAPYMSQPQGTHVCCASSWQSSIL